MNTDLPQGNTATVFRRAAALMGQPWETVDQETFEMLSSLFGFRLGALWSLAEWPEICHTERRLIAEPWSYGSAYVQGVGRYHHGTDAYYQVVDPAGVDGTEAPGESVKWVEIQRDYQALPWDPDLVYSYGDLAFRTSDEVVVCYVNGTPAAGVTPTNSSHWFGMVKGEGDFPIADVFGNNPDMGTVFRVSLDDPDSTNVEGPGVEHRVTEYGIRVAFDPASAWFRYREVTPDVGGGTWDTNTTYAAGEICYFEANRTGHYYTALSSTLGEQPSVSPDAWQQVIYPAAWESALAFGLHADWLRFDGLDEKAERAEGRYFREEERLLEILVRQQRQFARTRVISR